MRVGSFVLAALLATALMQDQALADGSIAVARSKDDLRFNMGVSFNYGDRASADAQAIAQCEAAENEVAPADRGACAVIATYDNMCMALARDTGSGGTAWGWGTDDYQADADDRAMRECRANAGGRAGQCQITMRHCDGSADAGK